MNKFLGSVSFALVIASLLGGCYSGMAPETQQPEADAGNTPTPVTCTAPATACGTTCRDLTSDNANCGTCGTTCAAGNSCRAGACVANTAPPPTCTAPARVCNNACRNVQTDNANCGSCGNICPVGNTCVAGACALNCAAPTTVCGNACRNVQTDANNCGRCGVSCGTGTCQAGVCVAQPMTCGRDDIDVVLPTNFHTECTGGMRTVVHGGTVGEDVVVEGGADGAYQDSAYRVARYLSAQGQALSISVRRGLWGGQNVDWSGYCPGTDNWAKGLHLWDGFNTAADAGAHFYYRGRDIAASCRILYSEFQGQMRYVPRCVIPATCN